MDKATWTTLAIGAGIMGAAAALRYYWNTTSSQSSVAASTTETTSSSSTSKSCSGGDDRSIQTNADLSSSLSAPRKCQESSDRAKAEVNEAKVIYFVRHGESLYNEHYERTGKDNMVWDAGLTAKGEQQARAAGETLRACGDTLDLCISSPLTRAINTCLLAVPPDSWHPKRYLAWAEPREVLEASCDIGSTVEDLTEQFPSFDFTGVPDVWWYTPPEDDFKFDKLDPSDPMASRILFENSGFTEDEESVEERAAKFMQRLWCQPEKSIAVFAHAEFLHHIVGKYFGLEEKWFGNGEVVRLELRKHQVAVSDTKFDERS